MKINEINENLSYNTGAAIRLHPYHNTDNTVCTIVIFSLANYLHKPENVWELFSIFLVILSPVACTVAVVFSSSSSVYEPSLPSRLIGSGAVRLSATAVSPLAEVSRTKSLEFGVGHN